MNLTRVMSFVLVATLSLFVGSCGAAVPQIAEAYDRPAPPSSPQDPGLSSTALLEYEIEKKIFCELREAVRAARAAPWRTGPTPDQMKPNPDDFLPLKWVAEVSLSFQVDESTALNPGLTLNTPMPNGLTGFGGTGAPSSFVQSFGLGLGGTFSSTSTRIDKFDPYYTIEYLSRPLSNQSICKPENDQVINKFGFPVSSPIVLNSELGLKDWLIGSLFVSRSMRSIGNASQSPGSPGGFHPDVLTLEIKFVVVTNGNITPQWKLVRVSANAGSNPLFGVGRMRTHDLIITVGPSKADTNLTHFASQIGYSVNSGRNVFQP